MSLFLIIIFILIGIAIRLVIIDITKKEIGERALAVAESIALMPEFIAAFNAPHPEEIIQPMILPITKTVDAEFIVVGNTKEIRYAHPNATNIGKKMVGEDNERVLRYGESYISQAKGTMGPSLRGKVPVKNEAGEVIGVVSVGFLLKNIEVTTDLYMNKLWGILLLIGLCGIIGVFFVSNRLKHALLGLEPSEIVNVVMQKEHILQSTKEGLIAVDANGKITLMNTMAQQILQKNTQETIGKSIEEVLPQSQILHVLHTKKGKQDYEVHIAENTLLVNSTPILYGQQMLGVVTTFRSKTELEWLKQELLRTQQYADALRAQTHEFSNKLHVLFGLLQLGNYDEAMALIRKESDIQQELNDVVVNNVRDVLISAMILGKYSSAKEQHITMIIDDTSTLQTTLNEQARSALLTALGNVIDNAIEVLQSANVEQKLIHIYFTDMGDDILFEIEDTGPGIAAEEVSAIFTRGYSTKNTSDRGIGLAISKTQLQAIGGDIYVEESDIGTCFMITLPKRGVEQ